MDRVTSMKVFVRAAGAGSLSAAARHMNMSPAMATKHVNALETRLGVKLFHRTTRGLSLTEAGTHYLDACERILPEIDAAEAEAASQRITPSGLLRMNVPLSFGTRYIAPLLTEFSTLYSEVQVELGLSDSRIDLLTGNWDMAIRIGHLKDSSLQTKQLGDSCLLVCAAPHYLAQHGTPHHIHDLSQHNCLSYTESLTQNQKHWFFGTQGEVAIPIRGNLLANNGDALLSAAVAGQGIIYQPHFIVGRAIQKGELIALELDKPTIKLGGIHVLYPPDRRPPAKVRVMIDYLATAFQSSPP